MNKLKLSICLGLGMIAGAAQAGGPLIVVEVNGDIKPLVWDMSNGAIPVYTDGGEAFTFDVDGVTPFVTLERANEITAHAFQQWSQVPTSTFEATIQGTIESQTGVADVTAANVADFIGTENGHGFWVIYDTDGSILENFFGVSPNSVLGISSPEFGDGNGHIVESWTVMNGWAVGAEDDGFPDVADAIFRGNFEADRHGERFAGVFTHEIGHAINLSHSQTNGHLAYQSYTYAPLYPGVPGCVDPMYRYDSADPNAMDPASIETMFPFIDPYGTAGVDQASVNMSDDMVAISNLYPTAAYLANTGTISGVLRLKDGSTEYSGINVIARNVNDPFMDAISDMTGSATQGLVGPDGKFSIRGLTPGEQYVVYIEEITSGGYPTTPRMMLSEGEYWDAAEGTDPAVDLSCNSTAITAVAGSASSADVTFNGYLDGIQFTPLVAAYMQSLSHDGTRAGGTAGGASRPLLWDKTDGIRVLPVWLSSHQGSINAAGTQMLVQVDPDGNGIREPAIWSENNALNFLGDLSGNLCGGASASGSDAAVGMGMDAAAQTVVGLAYIDRDGDGNCGAGTDETVPFIWDAANGMRELEHSVAATTQPWTRAHAISGNGRVVLGTSNLSQAWGWVDDGTAIDLQTLTGARTALAANYDGSVVAINSFDTVNFKNTGIVLWNAISGTDPSDFTNIDSLRYCVDVPLTNFFGDNLCETMTPEEAYEQAGVVGINVFGSNDAGTVLVGRAGDFFTGFYGAIWVKDVGWMLMGEFLAKQGVVEAETALINNPLAVSGIGDVILGGTAGRQFSWLIDLNEVYVCKNGVSTPTTFPDGLRTEVSNGALFGRCEFIN